MIAVCGGLMRTGSVAMWQVMREIVLKGGGKAPNLGTEFFKYIGDWTPREKYYLIKTHDYNEALDPAIGRCKVVVTIRDHRDAMISLMNFNDYDFDTAVNSRMFYGNPRNYYIWLDAIPEEDLLVVKYENFVTDRTETVLEVAEFLDIEIGEEEANKIDHKWNIEANKKRAKDRHAIKSHNYMSERHINSGEVDQWVESLTSGQADYIGSDPEVGDWLYDVGYPVRCNICYEYNDADKGERSDGVFTCDACKWDALETEAYGKITEEE